MNYKLALIGHPDTNHTIEQIIASKFVNISLTTIDVCNQEDINSTAIDIKSSLKNVDGVLFTAKDIYTIVNNKLQIELPSSHLDITDAELYRSLFIAFNEYPSLVHTISVDTVTYAEITRIFRKLGIPDMDKFTVQTVQVPFDSNDVVKATLLEHIKNYETSKCICFTSFTEVYKELKKRNIAVVLIKNDQNQVSERINNLISTKLLLSESQNDQAVMLISLSNLQEHIILENSEHSVVSEYNRITELVFWFAKKVQGAQISSDQRNYYIFCNRKEIEIETQDFSNLKILNDIASKNIVHASIGIGYGLTTNSAIKHANIALIKAKKEGISCAYINRDDYESHGPLFPLEQRNNKAKIYDEKLLYISEKSELSINKIYKLYGYTKERKTDCLTSNDVAELLGISQRSSNRIISKLYKCGCAEQVGAKSNGLKGRPIKVYRFHF